MEDKKKRPKLTVRTSVGLQSESNPSIGIPVQGDQADVASDHGVLELVLDHAVCVTVTWKGLKKKTHQQQQQQLVYCLSIHLCHTDRCGIPPCGSFIVVQIK